MPLLQVSLVAVASMESLPTQVARQVKITLALASMSDQAWLMHERLATVGTAEARLAGTCVTACCSSSCEVHQFCQKENHAPSMND